LLRDKCNATELGARRFVASTLVGRQRSLLELLVEQFELLHEVGNAHVLLSQPLAAYTGGRWRVRAAEVNCPSNSTLRCTTLRHRGRLGSRLLFLPHLRGWLVHGTLRVRTFRPCAPRAAIARWFPTHILRLECARTESVESAAFAV